MLNVTDDSFKQSIQDDTGLRPPWAVEAFTDVEDDVRQSGARILASPFIPHKDEVRGFVFDVATGKLNEVTWLITLLRIGTVAACSDGYRGQVRAVVIDPIAATVTHVVVEPEGRSGLARLVPLGLAEAEADADADDVRATRQAPARLHRGGVDEPGRGRGDPGGVRGRADRAGSATPPGLARDRRTGRGGR